MSITTYNTDFQVEHSFFGKARMASIEPFATFCRKVAEDRKFTEADHCKLIDIAHSAICKFFENYPKTRARIVRIQLELGSSLESLRFITEGYCGAGYLMYPTGERIEAETSLYKEEYQQYLEELKTNKPENSTSFWTYCDQALPNPGERVLVLVAELEYGNSPVANRSYDADYGRMLPDGSWETENDWDEGQPWGIVAWASIYDAEEANKHNVVWHNK